jgi:hypothetical protein
MLWPLALVALGALMIVRSLRRTQPSPSEPRSPSE